VPKAHVSGKEGCSGSVTSTSLGDWEMTIKQTVLPLADEYAKYSADDLGYPLLPKSSRAALIAALDAADREVERLTALQYRQAPCHRFCEANAFEIEIRGLKAENAKLHSDNLHITQAMMHAYGHLWHVNNEPMSPIPLYSPEKAAYEARKVLRDMLTHEQRGIAINQVQALIDAARAALEKL
jgi:hypothetical protein